MNDVAEKLVQMKRKIEEKKVEKSRLEGKLDQLLLTLKEKYGCSSVEEAQELLEKKKSRLDDTRQSLEERLAEIEEKYDWL
jgi:hypothetical protein